MSLLKNPWFWVVTGIVAVVSTYMLCSVFAVGAIFCYILTPTAFGLATRTYLDKCDYENDVMDAAWRPDTRV